MIWLAPSRYPLQLRWRPRAAAEAGAAGMPVRWPRRPAAVSEAVVADAEPDFSCAGELEQPLKALVGKVSHPPPGRSLGRLVGRSVGSGRAFDFLCWCALSGVVCGGWGSGFPCPRILDFMGVPPLFASRLLSWALYVCACWHDSFVELRLASRVPVSSSVSSWLARGIAIAGEARKRRKRNNLFRS